MAYTNYESISDVAEKFGITFSKDEFLSKKSFKINEKTGYKQIYVVFKRI